MVLQEIELEDYHQTNRLSRLSSTVGDSLGWTENLPSVVC